MGSKGERADRERWLGWAARAEWHFSSYYKYDFTFTATGRLWNPADPGPASETAGEFTATITVGGDSSAIYRYTVNAGPMPWRDVIACGWYEMEDGADPPLVVRRADRTLLFSTDDRLKV